MPTWSGRGDVVEEEVIEWVRSGDRETRLKGLRKVKNLIIGNPTKKVSFLKHGAVPAVASALSSSDGDPDVIVEASAVIGSFACGGGVHDSLLLPAVLDDANLLPLLFRLLHSPLFKVVDAVARSLKIIYHSKFTPKYDFLVNQNQNQNANLIFSLFNSQSDNLTALATAIITHSCRSNADQMALCHAGILNKLINLLLSGGGGRGGGGGGCCASKQRDHALESLAPIINNNPDVCSKFIKAQYGRPFKAVSDLIKDKSPRTRLLASICLIAIWNTSPPSQLQLQLQQHDDDAGLRNKLIHILLDLLDDPSQVGDEAPFALSSFIQGKKDLQKIAFQADIVDKISQHLNKDSMQQQQPKRLQGLLIALAHVSSNLEPCRSRFLSLEVLNMVVKALTHDNTDVRIAACACLKSVSRSIKNLSAGLFMNEAVVIPLIQLLNDVSATVQVAALGAVVNVVVEFTSRKSAFLQYGGVKQLVHLSTSMDCTIRLNAIWALKNLIFLAENQFKDLIFQELTPSTLSSLICDPEPCVQEQALCFARNLVHGCINCIEHVFVEDGMIIHAVGRQLKSSSKSEVCVQGMYVLANVATGNELHKEAVLEQLLPLHDSNEESVLIKFLQSSDEKLRTATVWTVVNLTFPSSPGVYSRVVKLRQAGIDSQIKNLNSDPCLDVKLRAKTAMGQLVTFSDCYT